MNEPPAQGPRPPAAPTILIFLLAVFAALTAAGGLFAAVAWLLAAARAGAVNLPVVIQSACLLLGGASAGSLLWALSYVLRRYHWTSMLQRQILASLQERLGPRAATPARGYDDDSSSETDTRLLRSILAKLEDLGDTMLLSETQKETKRRRRQAALADNLAEESDLALVDGDLSRATEAVRRLGEHVPDDERLDDLQRRLDTARAAAEAEDLKLRIRTIEDLMATAAFDEAKKAAQELLAAHPAAVEAIAIMDRLKREADAFQAEQRRRLLAEVERHAGARQWRPAFGAAKRLVEAYPGCAEAEMVTAQMPTLRDNARIEETRQLRDGIGDLISRKRFAEAVEVAEDLIRRFPQTRAAADLRKQMPKLLQRAAETGTR